MADRAGRTALARKPHRTALTPSLVAASSNSHRPSSSTLARNIRASSATSTGSIGRMMNAGAQAASSRDLPGGAVLGVLQHDAHGGELVADTVGFGPVLRRAGIESRARSDFRLSAVVDRTLALRPFRAASPSASRKPKNASVRQAPSPAACEAVHFGDGFRRIEIVGQRIEHCRRGALASALSNSRQVRQRPERLFKPPQAP